MVGFTKRRAEEELGRESAIKAGRGFPGPSRRRGRPLSPAAPHLPRGQVLQQERVIVRQRLNACEKQRRGVLRRLVWVPPHRGHPSAGCPGRMPAAVGVTTPAPRAAPRRRRRAAALAPPPSPLPRTWVRQRGVPHPQRVPRCAQAARVQRVCYGQGGVAPQVRQRHVSVARQRRALAQPAAGDDGAVHGAARAAELPLERGIPGLGRSRHGLLVCVDWVVFSLSTARGAGRGVGTGLCVSQAEDARRACPLQAAGHGGARRKRRRLTGSTHRESSDSAGMDTTGNSPSSGTSTAIRSAPPGHCTATSSGPRCASR